MEKVLKIFQMGEDGACDWVLAYTKSEAKKIYASVTDVPEDEDIHELTGKEMNKLQFIDDINDPENSPRRSFADELRNRIAKGEGAGMFASTEY